MQHTRHFTLEEASGLLPWLRSQLGQLEAAKLELARLQQRRETLFREVRTNGHGEAGRGVSDARQAVDLAAERLTRLAQEVADRGILLRDTERGLVDFPALRDGREVYLCWLLGEDDIRFWHDVDAGFAGRKLL
ncbi:MAG: DUF2203 domain-containing protein [Chloroflexi bacterium]|nr:DUF2203 domain-containing protein [Chloroflexota bacterium]